jgi:beta-N-acetylhexosaminidase
MITNTQSYSKLGLLIAVDEEGGVVNRLMSTLGTTHFDSMYNYRNDGTETAHDNAQTIGSDIAAYGFNTDFAPVADVWSNPSNTVIGYRAYSDDYEQAAELVAAAVSGFHDAGVACTLKHFPGHGDTAEDSHYSSAYVSKTKEELEAEEWLPFQTGIDAGADLVMIGHLSVPSLDSVPATISHTIVTDILRGELGFDGVVITDSLEMSSVSNLYSSDELAVLAIEAGVDLLLEPSSFRTAVNGVIAALDSGRLTEERINESVLRILTLKLKYGIIS